MDQTANESTRVVLAALAGNLAIALTKFAAALFSGSSAMLSEAIHSTVDTGNQALLLYGQRRSAKPPDETHPFGHGMELFFWGFVVALLVFALGGAMSIWQGVRKLDSDAPLEDVWINLAVLAASALFEFLSFRVSVREARRRFGDKPILASIRASKDPSLFAVLVEDSAALIGLAIAAAGVTLAWLLEKPMLDGAASIAIGVLLVGASLVLARETKSLLTGEAASPAILATARTVLRGDKRLAQLDGIASLQLGPREVLLAVTARFDPALDAAAVEAAIGELTDRINQDQVTTVRMFLRPAQT
ncbi:cation diffusion facilitator family transporter [Roseiterribacter gracilis]|uniref:Cation transporter n=1 Tax=Roseiterribacter gracilis TaxID=2812848 RepID=A0A8S8X9U4_9PROT|nr:cation transporter [Rhodospirillales bacterium TMPK1]